MLIHFWIPIKEARCRCQGCLEETRVSQTQVCEPVTLPVTVLRKTGQCIKGVFEYEPSTYHLQLSCTCAVKREHESSSPLPSTPPEEEDLPGM